MHHRKIVFSCVFAASAAILLVAQVPAVGQQTAPAKKAWTPGRTPDGDPDIAGVYDARTATPVERPKELGAKEF